MMQTEKLTDGELFRLSQFMYHAKEKSANDDMFYEMACLEADVINRYNGHEVAWLI